MGRFMIFSVLLVAALFACPDAQARGRRNPPRNVSVDIQREGLFGRDINKQVNIGPNQNAQLRAAQLHAAQLRAAQLHAAQLQLNLHAPLPLRVPQAILLPNGQVIFQ